MRAAEQFQELAEALERESAACLGDTRFTADEITPEDAVEMRGMCRACPVVEMCAAYAVKARPEAGFWAGREYRPKSRSERDS